jgi:hypothetical protein
VGLTAKQQRRVSFSGFQRRHTQGL